MQEIRTRSIHAINLITTSVGSPRRHLLFLVIALFVGLSFFSRHLTALAVLGSNYNVFAYNPEAVHQSRGKIENYDYQPDALIWDETAFYGRYTQQILRGDIIGNSFSLYQPYLLDQTSSTRNQGFPFFFSRGGPVVIALLALVLGDVRQAFMLADMIFPALIAFLVVWLCWYLRHSIAFAITALSLFMWFNWSDINNLLHGGRGIGEITFLRTPFPQVSTVFFVLFLITIADFVTQPNLRAVGFLIILLPLNFLTYEFSGLVVFAITAALIPVALLHRDRGSFIGYSAAIGLVVVLLSGAALSAPAWIGIIQSSPVFGALVAERPGAHSHLPDVGRTVIVALFWLPTFMIRFRKWDSRLFWSAIWLGAIVVLNQQVLTGVNIEADHITGNFLEPLFMIYMLDVVLVLVPPISGKLAALAAGLVFFVGFGQAATRGAITAQVQIPFTTKDPAFEQLASTLNKQDRRYVVVTGDLYLNNVLPAYIPQRLLVPKTIDDPMSSNQRDMLRNTAANLLGYSNWNEMMNSMYQVNVPVGGGQSGLMIDRSKVIVVTNRHLHVNVQIDAPQLIMSNADFQVGFLAGVSVRGSDAAAASDGYQALAP